MKKFFSRSVRVFLALLFLMSIVALAGSSLAEGNSNPDSCQEFSVFSLLQDFGDVSTVQDELQSKMDSMFKPFTIDCGDVQATVKQLLYDGMWMFTAVNISPTNPDTVLVIPGSAELDDPIAGIHNENARNDERSFIDAACEDGKRLLSVYVYPKEFDESGEYMMDYRQQPGNDSLFLCCAYIASEAPINITWSAQVYEIDLDTMNSTMLANVESECQEVSPLEEAVFYEYQLTSGTEAPFDKLTMMKTALATYVLPQWDKPEDQYKYDVGVLDPHGELLPNGLTPDARAVSVFEMSQYIVIELNGDDSNPLRFGLVTR